MTIKFHCDCGVRIKAPDAMGGKTVKCPACHEKVAVPRLGEDPDSYSLSGTKQGDEGWATPYKRKKLEKKKPQTGSTYRPTRGTDTTDMPGAPTARPTPQKKQKKKTGWLDSFIYPFRGENIFTYIGWTIGFTFIMFMMSIPMFGLFVIAAAIVIFLIAAGFFFHFLSEVVRTAAAGEDTLPDTSSGDEVFLDAFNWWACTILCMSPYWVFQLINYWGQIANLNFTPRFPGAIGQFLLILCLLYLPMALLATALFNTFLAANPVYVIGAILKCPLQYFTSCFIIVSVQFVYTILDLTLTQFLMAISILFIPLINILSGNLLLYVSIVVAHQLGTVYHRNRKRIGWFRDY